MSIPVGRPDITDLEIGYVTRAVVTNQLSKGEHQKEFEQLLCDWTGHDYAVGLSSGTAALHLALIAHGVGPGDEVIVPTLTFAAVAAAVRHAGATPVFVGSRCDSCMSAHAVRRAVSPRTRAVIAVHSYGVRADIPLIEAAAPGIPVIVDASQGHGMPTPGHTEIMSFHGNKVATCGEGGALLTDDSSIADKCRWLSTHAQDDLQAFWHTAVGYNYKLTNLQAALGCAQLRRIDELIANRQRVADWYAEDLNIFQFDTPWLVSVIVNERDELSAQLTSEGIEHRAWFPLIHTMPPYQQCNYYPADSHAERLSARGINLPTFGGMTREEVKQVVEVVRRCAS